MLLLKEEANEPPVNKSLEQGIVTEDLAKGCYRL
jgi:hypothetical protein